MTIISICSKVVEIDLVSRKQLLNPISPQTGQPLITTPLPIKNVMSLDNSSDETKMAGANLKLILTN